MLNVSPTRVRQLIAQGSLPAQKVGCAWVLRDEDVMQRAAAHLAGGHPRTANSATSRKGDNSSHAGEASHTSQVALVEIYRACKEALSTCPSAAEIAAIDSPEEAVELMRLTKLYLERLLSNLSR